MPMEALENAQPSTSDMNSGNRSDEGTTTGSHEKSEKSKPGAAWKQNEVHEVPHKQAPFVLSLRTSILNLFNSRLLFVFPG